jgi:hypothetical protein
MGKDVTGVISVQFEGMSMSHGDSQTAYFRMALEFALGAELILAHSPVPMPAVVGENAAHSLELALRSFLLSKMTAVQAKSVSKRHDLEKLWTAAEKKGLPIDPVVPEWCKMLNAGHSDLARHAPYLFRYPKDNTGVVLSGDVVQQLRIVLTVVGDTLGLDQSGNFT